MSTFSPERLQELSNGYDLDGGGYSFGNTDHAELAGCVVLDSGLDYLDSYTGNDGRGQSLAFYAFRPCGVYGPVTPKEWPASIPYDGDGRYVLQSSGMLAETEHECSNCGGLGYAEDIDGVENGEPCPRCGGTDSGEPGNGYVISEGGEWALYAFEEFETEEGEE